MSDNIGKIRINDGAYVIVHLETHSVVIVGKQDGRSVAITPDTARALAGELINFAIMAEDPDKAEPPMFKAFGPKNNTRM
jgi:hypothetical protein